MIIHDIECCGHTYRAADPDLFHSICSQFVCRARINFSSDLWLQAEQVLLHMETWESPVFSYFCCPRPASLLVAISTVCLAAKRLWPVPDYTRWALCEHMVNKLCTHKRYMTAGWPGVDLPRPNHVTMMKLAHKAYNTI